MSRSRQLTLRVRFQAWGGQFKLSLMGAIGNGREMRPTKCIQAIFPSLPSTNSKSMREGEKKVLWRGGSNIRQITCHEAISGGLRLTA